MNQSVVKHGEDLFFWNFFFPIFLHTWGDFWNVNVSFIWRIPEVFLPWFFKRRFHSLENALCIFLSSLCFTKDTIWIFKIQKYWILQERIRFKNFTIFFYRFFSFLWKVNIFIHVLVGSFIFFFLLLSFFKFRTFQISIRYFSSICFKRIKIHILV